MSSSVVLNSNLSSLSTQRRLSDSSRLLSKSLERLSSGLRINSAADDAAGLAIADSLNADRRVFNQGIRNLNDGLSLLNVVDGALSELSSIVVRIRELSEQSANGTLSHTQRQALDQEAQALSDEFTRIIQTTEVNGLNPFSGEFGELSLQAGYGAISGRLGGLVGDGTFESSIGPDIGGNILGVLISDFNLDGHADIAGTNILGGDVVISYGNGDGTFSDIFTVSLGGQTEDLKAGDFNGDGMMDIAVTDYANNDLVILLNDGQGNFSSGTDYSTLGSAEDVSIGDINNDGVLDVFVQSTGTRVNVFLGNGDGTFQDRITLPTFNTNRGGTLGDLNNDGNLDIVVTNASGVDAAIVFLGNGDGTFASSTSHSLGNNPSAIEVADVNNDGNLDLLTTQTGTQNLLISLGNGDGTFESAQTFDVDNEPRYLNVGDFNSDGNLDAVTSNLTGNSISVLIGNGDGTFQDRTDYTLSSFPRDVTVGDLNSDGVDDILGTSTSTGRFRIFLSNVTSGVAAIQDFSLADRAGALQSMAMLDRKIESLALQKGTIGAFQSRVETAINNLQITSTNYAAAESQIRDVDVAREAAELARLSILQQAGAAILGQANIQPQIALRLLET